MADAPGPAVPPGSVVFAAHYDGTSAEDDAEIDATAVFASEVECVAEVDKRNREWVAAWDWRKGSTAWSVKRIVIR